MMKDEAAHGRDESDAAAPMPQVPPMPPPAGTVGEVFVTFLRLGLTSFGGPIAHLGYFRDELVTRRGWIDERGYGDLVALCQFLPGPASSQVGFAMGLMRAGPAGALAAFIAFTLPSALILFFCAGAAAGFDTPAGHAVLHGLKLVAVAVVAQAVFGMARALAPDRPRAAIVIAALFLVLLGGALAQILAIATGAVCGMILCRGGGQGVLAGFAPLVGRKVGLVCLALFLLLLVLLPLAAAMTGWPVLQVADGFYRSGALVFGGGHVVLPLLKAEVVGGGFLAEGDFLAGYGLAQAMPGPLFTFAAYLGAMMAPATGGIFGAALCLGFLFLPGFLMLVAALPFAGLIGRSAKAQAAMRGANAAVVGILAAALYDPLWTSAVLRPVDFALAVTGFLLLTLWKAPPWAVVVMMVLAALMAG